MTIPRGKRYGSLAAVLALAALGACRTTTGQISFPVYGHGEDRPKAV